MIESAKTRSQSRPAEGLPLPEAGRSCAESRLDPLTGQWTIYAPHRGARPDEYVVGQVAVNPDLECPFCAGNESSTPEAVWIGHIEAGKYRLRRTGGAADKWSVRVVPNLYPAVQTQVAQPARQTHAALFQKNPIGGGHEVIIESREHLTSASQLDPAEIELVFLAYRDRIRHWRSVPGIAYINLFKNAGQRAGASLRHSHSQLIATDRIPLASAVSVGHLQRHRAATGCCLQCDLIRGETKARERVVWTDDSLIAFCPFASHLPMLLRITAKQHAPCFEDLDDATIASVSRLVQRGVRWLEQLRPGTDYNFVLSTRPPGAHDPTDAFHWSIDLFPRMTQIAGFELSSGAMINPVLPETAAAAYRSMAAADERHNR